MQLTRRKLIEAMAIGSTGLLVPALTLGQNQGLPANPLQIPPLLTGEARSGKQHYSLTARRGSSRFLPNLTTPTFGFNGDYLGPTLRLKRDDDVVLHVSNTLGEPTTVHWHGLHVPASADGGPAQIVEDGASWDPEFRVMQKAGTFWYHSHLLGKTGEQVYHGLAGMILIDDEESANSSLPSTYGVDDIPLIIQDRRFNADGSFRYVGSHMDVMMGFFGDTILVNGTTAPVFSPSTTKVRFRVLNAANARTLSIALDDGRAFQLVATDGGLLQQPLDTGVVVLAPSERAEIVVDVSDGRPVKLVSLPMPASSPFSAQGMMRNMSAMNGVGFELLSLQPGANRQRAEAVAPTLTTLARIPASEAVRTRQLKLEMVMGMGMMGRGGGGPGAGGRGGMMGGGNFFINGAAMDMAVINHRVRMGDTEIWEITNDSMMMHPFHIHHSQFQILDRNGQPPAAHELGFKDTVKVGPGETVRFIMRFENFADSERAYMYHCHILEHEDNGMMGQFVVE